jgi:hypothetical protein
MRGHHRNSFAWGGERAASARLIGRLDLVFEMFGAKTTNFSRKTTYFPSGKPLFWAFSFCDGFLWIPITLYE